MSSAQAINAPDPAPWLPEHTCRNRRQRTRPDENALFDALWVLEARVRHCDQFHARCSASNESTDDYIRNAMGHEADRLREVCAWLRHQRDLARAPRRSKR